MTVKAFAPAKINLTLHVTGQRPDGYHLLDSLVVFADVGDHIEVAAAPELSLRISGPMAAGLTADADNLVLRAALLFECPSGALIRLDKQLPLASGLGGGSADAAATLRVLAELWGQPMPRRDQTVTLGADVPVCMMGAACRMRGIGDEIQTLAAWPALPAVLVNPGQAVSTPAVFAAMQRRTNPPMPDQIPFKATVQEAAAWLAMQRNDMQAAAIVQQPEISRVLNQLAAIPACLLARMSGSGATCFGLFPDQASAQSAAEQLAKARPDWWVRSAVLG